MSVLKSMIGSVRVGSREFRLRPLGAGKALVQFLIAGVLLRLSIYNIGPWLLAQGMVKNAFESFVITWTVPLALLFAAAFAAARLEGVPENARALAERFRLKRPKRRDGLLIGLGLLISFASFVLVPLRDWTMSLSPIMGVPDSFPVMLDPSIQGPQMVAAIKAWIGPEGIENMGYVALILILFFFNSFGEELYWRGIVLPRQELTHGRWTWVVHGAMWTLFHVPVYPWYLIYSLPITLGLAFVAQKSGNTWVPIILHAIQNLYMYGLLIAIVVGAA